MTHTTAALRSMRYFDRFVLRGKRMILGVRHQDPCTYEGHEEVLGFLMAYCNDGTMREDIFKWDDKSLRDLEHIQSCPYCMARVFSTPDPQLRVQTEQALQLLEAV